MAGGGSSEVRDLAVRVAKVELQVRDLRVGVSVLEGEVVGLRGMMRDLLAGRVEPFDSVNDVRFLPGKVVRAVGPVADQLVAKSEVGGVKVLLSVQEGAPVLASPEEHKRAAVSPKRRR